jgi:serine/threonine protein phosphatase PrpC
MTLSLRYAVRSDRGLVRGNNEDSVYAGPRLLVIADGMGGHAAGEVASKLVVRSLERLDEDRPVADLLAALRAAVEEANHDIADAIDSDSELDGMGTTLTALRFVGNQVGLVHVGDSRAYLLRAEHLSQITHDDTYVQSLVDAGRLTPEEAAYHPRKSVILRALMGAEVDPDVSIREARAGDRYLLCTDGLSDVVTAPTLLETLSEGDPQECADRLVELALRGGGPDNVTCIVADVVDVGYGDEVPVIGGALDDVETTTPTERDDSPAERAAQMTRANTPSASSPPPVRRKRRRWLRPFVITAAALVVIIGGSAAFYAWTQQQYFVGRDGTEVAIFRGVNTSFGPLRFYGVAENTVYKMTDLDPATQNQVAQGITATSLPKARTIVTNLASHELPTCTSLQAAIAAASSSAAAASSSSSAAASSSSAAAARSSAASRSRAARSSASKAKAGAKTTPKAAAKTTATPTPTPVVPSSPAAPSSAARQPQLGVDCR